MSIIYVLLAISVTVALVFFAAFVFSVKSGQFDDTYTPSIRMLFDDELVKENSTSVNISESKPITNKKKL